MNREQWLTEGVILLQEYVLREHALIMPDKWRIACSWPTHSARRILGQCINPAVTPNNMTEIYISPSIATGFEALDTTLHECIHAAVGVDVAHGKLFKQAIKKLGMGPTPATAGVLEGTPAFNAIYEILEELGEYPHQGLHPFRKIPKNEEKKKSRVRVFSPQDQNYSVIIPLAILEKYGPPTDPFGNPMGPKQRKT